MSPFLLCICRGDTIFRERVGGVPDWPWCWGVHTSPIAPLVGFLLTAHPFAYLRQRASPQQLHLIYTPKKKYNSNRRKVSVATCRGRFVQSDHTPQQYPTAVQMCNVSRLGVGRRGGAEFLNRTDTWRRKKSGQTERGWKCEKSRRARPRVRSVKAGIQLPISCRQQAAVLTMAADSPLPPQPPTRPPTVHFVL